MDGNLFFKGGLFMKESRMLYAAVFCFCLFFLPAAALPADALMSMTSIDGISKELDPASPQDCPAEYPVDCGDGTCCPVNTVCVPDNQCCDETVPYYCGNYICAASAAHCPVSSLDCPAQKVLGHDNPKLDNLRSFRDTRLAQSFIGIRIIGIYYTNAARINAALDRSPALRIVVTRLLEKIAPMLGDLK